MGDRTRIEWTDATWNPVRGCSRVSEGCRHCYAEQVAARFSGPGMAYEGLAKRVGGEARWTGKVVMVPKHLGDPLRWTKPRRVFVNSMSDLFHEGLSFDEIAAVFGVMYAAERHTFQVLTKRPQRALQFFAWAQSNGIPLATCLDCAHHRLADPRVNGERFGDGVWREFDWPLRNVWIGVSVEDQATADERIPLLLQIPAAVRFVSYEPALGPVVFRPWLTPNGERFVFPNIARSATTYEQGARFIDWVIVGGESGPGARPFDVAWARNTVEQCRTAGVACFVKQLGSQPMVRADEDTALWGNFGRFTGKGGNWFEWAEDLRVRQFPEASA